MEKITIVRNHVDIIGEASVKDIYNKIRGKGYRPTVEEIRHYLRMGNKDEADKLKRCLTGFTASGTFNGKRDTRSLREYSQILILDLDGLSPLELAEAKQRAVFIPYTLMAFISPSGYGLKIMLRVNSSVEHHKIAYSQVLQYYEDELGVKFDSKTSDVARLCYMSWDIDAYYNPDSEIFKVLIPERDVSEDAFPTTPQSYYRHDLESVLEYVKQLKNTKDYQEGNRNNFLFVFACNCNGRGIPKTETLKFCLSFASDLSVKEITQIVEGVYRRFSEQYGQLKNCNIENIASPSSVVEPLKIVDTPTIPSEVFESLPLFLKETTSKFKSERERDIFLTGALGVLSACFYQVKGIYNNSVVHPNLYGFVVAPPASGKSVLTFAIDLASDYHDLLLERSEVARMEYLRALDKYEKAGGDGEDRPEEPPFVALYIPGNSSSASIYGLLNDSGGIGLLCETEADTLSNALKQDWGGFSDIMRKAYHHERLSYSRKANKEYVQIRDPRLSVVLSGTPSQVTRLIGSAEDGLFSRFLFYTFRNATKWKDVSPRIDEPSLADFFKEYKGVVSEMAEHFSRYPFVFHLTDIQWQKLNEVFAKKLNKITCFVNEEAGSNVLRHGLMVYRIAMVLTVLRAWKEGYTESCTYCKDVDFDNALILGEIYLEHALAVYQQLPRSLSREDEKFERFFKELPIEFERQVALTIGSKQFNVSERTIDNYLRKLADKNYLEKVRHNHYRKTAA